MSVLDKVVAGPEPTGRRFVTTRATLPQRYNVLDTLTGRAVYLCTRSEARLWVASASLFTTPTTTSLAHSRKDR